MCGYKSSFESFGASAIAEALYDFEDGLISVFELASWRLPIISHIKFKNVSQKPTQFHTATSKSYNICLA
jgi:hypothetical protein